MEEKKEDKPRCTREKGKGRASPRIHALEGEEAPPPTVDAAAMARAVNDDDALVGTDLVDSVAGEPTHTRQGSTSKSTSAAGVLEEPLGEADHRVHMLRTLGGMKAHCLETIVLLEEQRSDQGSVRHPVRPFSESERLRHEEEMHLRQEIVKGRLQAERVKLALVEHHINRVKDDPDAVGDMHALTLQLCSHARFVEHMARVSELEGDLMLFREDHLRHSKEADGENVLSKVNKLSRAMLEFLLKGRSSTPVERILNDLTTPTGETVQLFLNSCLAEGGESKAMPKNVREFAVSVVESVSKDSWVEKDRIQVALENHIFSLLYPVCMKVSHAFPQKDAKLRDQFAYFGNISQDQFGIPEKYQSQELIPYALPIATLKTICLFYTPRKKLYAILSAFRELYSILEERMPGELIAGKPNEDVLRVWRFIVLKAGPKDLFRMITFIRGYVDPSLLTTDDLGKYLNRLEEAGEAILRLSRESLHHPSMEIVNKTFLAPERTRFQCWALTNGRLDIVEDSIRLSGYQLFAVEEWVWRPGCIYTCLVVPTGNEEDMISAAVLKPNDKASLAHLEFLNGIFFRPKMPGMRAIETSVGHLLVADLQELPKTPRLTLIRVPNGNFDEFADQFHTLLSLKRLGCGADPSDRRTMDDAVEQLHSLYHLSPNTSATLAINTIVTEAQILLHHLHYLPFLCPIDGQPGELTMLALTNFSTEYNRGFVEPWEDSDASHRIPEVVVPENGQLSPLTLVALRSRLRDILRKMRLIGFECTLDPVKDRIPFQNVVKGFQRVCGIFSDGQLGRKTLQVLEGMVGKMMERQKKKSFEEMLSSRELECMNLEHRLQLAESESKDMSQKLRGLTELNEEMQGVAAQLNETWNKRIKALQEELGTKEKEVLTLDQHLKELRMKQAQDVEEREAERQKIREAERARVALLSQMNFMYSELDEATHREKSLREEYEALQLQNQALQNQEKTCSICMDAPIEAVFVPCYHACVCRSCAQLAQDRRLNRCPICRKNIHRTHTIFIV